MRPSELFRKLALRVAHVVGTFWAFLAALASIIIWLAVGPLFGFSDTWQLAINTGTTIVTFLMVFLIQATQNRDSKAVHLKLDELIRSTSKARNTFADLENASDEEMDAFHREFERLRESGLKPGKAIAESVRRVKHPNRN